MSRSPSAVPQDDIADPPRVELVQAESEAALGTLKTNLESRPNATPDHQPPKHASSSKPDLTSLVLEDASSTSTASSQPLRAEDAVRAKTEEDQAATPLEISRDTTLKEGHLLIQAPEAVSPATLSPSSSLIQPTLPVAIPPSSSPPTTSYIPPSRPRAARSPIPKTPHEEETSVLPKGGSMFRITTPAQRRRNMANTNALTNYEADLTSRDRAKQKEAVRRFLDEKIENNWEWPRPPNAPAGFVDHLKDTGREATRWKERDEWLSNTNDTDDEPSMPTAASPDTVSPVGSFKFESPDDVGDSIRRRELERKRRRERKLQSELAYNEGLQCFTARRDAWTGARRVPRNPESKTSSRTLTSAIADLELSPPPTLESQDENDDHNSSDSDFDIEIPVAPPILPPNSGMRSNITPAAYNTIYDKVVLQSVSPSCPVNLQDVISACVQGWKRDGEWPPKSTVVHPPAASATGKRKGRKLSVAGIFGLSRIAKEIAEDEKEKEKASEEGGLRRGLQKMLGLRKESNAESINGNGNGHGHGHGHIAKA